jgi:hypothetical protein
VSNLKNDFIQRGGLSLLYVVIKVGISVWGWEFSLVKHILNTKQNGENNVNIIKQLTGILPLD